MRERHGHLQKKKYFVFFILKDVLCPSGTRHFISLSYLRCKDVCAREAHFVLQVFFINSVSHERHISLMFSLLLFHFIFYCGIAAQTAIAYIYNIRNVYVRETSSLFNFFFGGDYFHRCLPL